MIRRRWGGATTGCLAVVFGLLSGCADGAHDASTSTTVTTTIASASSETLHDTPHGELTIETFRQDGLLCYTVGTIEGDIVSQGCPESDPPQDDLIFGESAQDGEGWYAVVWIRDSAVLTTTSDEYVRSDGGWTVFQSSQSGLFWFDVENMEATFHCTIEFSWIDCAMTQAPPTS